MTSLDERREEYEDALFGVLMQHAMDAEGSALRIHNERCKQAEQSISPETDARCRKAVTDEFAARDAQLKWKKRSRVFRTLLIAAIVFTMMFSTVYASVPAVQEKVAEITQSINGTTLRFFTGNRKNLMYLRGYEFTPPSEYYRSESYPDIYIELVRSNSAQNVPETIRLRVSAAEDITISTRGQPVEQANYGGYPANVIHYPEGSDNIVLMDHERGNVIMILGMAGASFESLEEIANQVRYVGESPRAEATDKIQKYVAPSMGKDFALEEKIEKESYSYRRYVDGKRRMEVTMTYDIGDTICLDNVWEDSSEVYFGDFHGFVSVLGESVDLLLYADSTRHYLKIHGEGVSLDDIYEYAAVISDRYPIFPHGSAEIAWDSESTYPLLLPSGYDMDNSDRACLGAAMHYACFTQNGGRVQFRATRSNHDMIALADAYEGEPVTINGNDGYYLKRPNGEYIITFDAERKVYLEVLTIGKPGRNIYDLAEEFRFREE